MEWMRRAFVLAIAAIAAIVLVHAVTCAGTCAAMPSPPCAPTHVADADDHLPEAVEAAAPLALLILALLAGAVMRPMSRGAAGTRTGSPTATEPSRPPPPLDLTTARRLARLSLLLC